MAAPMIYKEPPYCRLKALIDDTMKEKLLKMNSSLSSLLNSEELHKMLAAERRLLHISIYKRSNQLRIDKSKQLLRRVKACLQRLSIVGRIFSLGSDVKMDINRTLTIDEKDVLLPSQQVLTFLLHITSSYFDLLNKTMEYSEAAFEFVSCQLTTGMLIPTMMLFMGILARIWQLSRSLQTRLSDFYNVVYATHHDMKPTMSDWVYPSLPAKLGIGQRPSPILQTALDLACCKEQELQIEETTSDSGKDISHNPTESYSDGTEDLGVSISSNKRKEKRSDDKFLSSKKRKKIQSQIDHLQDCRKFPTTQKVKSQSSKGLLRETTNNTENLSCIILKTVAKKTEDEVHKKKKKKKDVSDSKQILDEAKQELNNDNELSKKKLVKKKKKNITSSEPEELFPHQLLDQVASSETDKLSKKMKQKLKKNKKMALTNGEISDSNVSGDKTMLKQKIKVISNLERKEVHLNFAEKHKKKHKKIKASVNFQKSSSDVAPVKNKGKKKKC